MPNENIALQRWSEAKKWVLHHGKKSNTEHLYAYDAVTGSVLAKGTNGLPGRVQIPEIVVKSASDRKREIGIHHNHPNSSGLTAADFRVLAGNPGITAIVAHAHDGCDYIAKALERGNISNQIVCLDTALQYVLRNDNKAAVLHRQGVLLALQGHLLGLALSASGVVLYQAILSVETQVLYDRLSPHIDSWVKAAVLSCPIVRKS
jgi:hypothetical protein